MGRRMSTALTWLVTGAATVGLAAPAGAAPTWLAPMSPGSSAVGELALGTAASGDSVAAWIDGDDALVASVRSPGGGFGAPQSLAGPGAGNPAVGVADDGTAIVAWSEGSLVRYALRAAGGAFGAPGTLWDGGVPSQVRVAVNPGGEALVAFATDRARVAVGSTRAAPGAPQGLSPAAACGLDADLAADGHAAVAWRACGSGAAGVARRAPGGSFGAAETLPEATGVAVAVQENGTTVAATELADAIDVTEAPAGGSFGAAKRISGEAVAEDPALAAAGDEVWAAWRQGATGSRVAVAHRPAGAAFGAPALVSGAGVIGPPRLAGGSRGMLALAWLRDAGSAGILAEAAHRLPGAAAFEGVRALSAEGSGAASLRLAADGDGNALAAYVRAGAPVVHALDAAGPRPLAIEARTAGYAREPYLFAFDPVDAWSAVAEARIDFGDGTGVAASRGEHAYASPGDKTVTFSATDTVGNTASAQWLFQAAPPLDRTAPVIRRARLDAARFRISGKRTPITAAVRRGTRFRYRLSEPAQVTIFFERVRLGRRRGDSCERGRRRGRRCRVYEPVGLITRTHPVAGKVSTAFSGRIVGYQGTLKVADIRLRPGRYRSTLVAADAARNASKPVELAFTVLR